MWESSHHDDLILIFIACVFLMSMSKGCSFIPDVKHSGLCGSGIKHHFPWYHLEFLEITSLLPKSLSLQLNISVMIFCCPYMEIALYSLQWWFINKYIGVKLDELLQALYIQTSNPVKQTQGINTTWNRDRCSYATVCRGTIEACVIQ